MGHLPKQNGFHTSQFSVDLDMDHDPQVKHQFWGDHPKISQITKGLSFMLGVHILRGSQSMRLFFVVFVFVGLVQPVQPLISDWQNPVIAIEHGHRNREFSHQKPCFQ